MASRSIDLREGDSSEIGGHCRLAFVVVAPALDPPTVVVMDDAVVFAPTTELIKGRVLHIGWDRSRPVVVVSPAASGAVCRDEATRVIITAADLCERNV